MRYLARLLSIAFQRSLVRTDLLAAVLTAIAPTAYVLWGEKMTDSLALQISVIVSVLVGSVVVLRLLVAPYIIWTEDQEIILDLRSKLGAPEQGAKVTVQRLLAEDRVRLSDLIADATEQIMATRSEAACIDLLSSHRAKFAKHGIDKAVSERWRSFENNAFSYASGFPNASKLTNKENARALAETHEQRMGPALVESRDALIRVLLYMPSDKE